MLDSRQSKMKTCISFSEYHKNFGCQHWLKYWICFHLRRRLGHKINCPPTKLSTSNFKVIDTRCMLALKGAIFVFAFITAWRVLWFFIVQASLRIATKLAFPALRLVHETTLTSCFELFCMLTKISALRFYRRRTLSSILSPARNLRVLPRDTRLWGECIDHSRPRYGDIWIRNRWIFSSHMNSECK